MDSPTFVLGTVTAIGVLLTGIGQLRVSRKTKEIHKEVKPTNGSPPLAQTVEAIAEQVLPWDGIERRHKGR